MNAAMWMTALQAAMRAARRAAAMRAARRAAMRAANVRGVLLAAIALAAAACGPSITGLEVEATFDPALDVDQLRFTLSADGAAALDPIVAPKDRKVLTSGDESAGFIVPDDMVGKDVTVDVVGLVAGTSVAHGTATKKAAAGAITKVAVALAANGAAVCGDGVITVPEECDDGGAGDGDGCSSACRVEFGYDCNGEPSVCQQCGDGVAQGSEGCDDANLTDGDGCSSCHVDDGFVCNNDVAPSACSSACGDGDVSAVEACDDHNNDDGDGCSAVCGVEPGYACNGVPSVCAPICGDGLVTAPEQCDDGGVGDGDGCSAACATEEGFDCSGEPSACTPICGDALVVGAEECDDGVGGNSDTAPNACRTDCTDPRCGDGVTDDQLGEDCDDDNTDDGDGCLTGCRAPACGDGFIEPGVEECDDGNTADGDGCTSSCTIDPLFRCGGASPSVCAPLDCAAHPCAHTVAGGGGGEFFTLGGALGSGAVASGDVLFVSPGTYNEHLDIFGKDVVVVAVGAGVVVASNSNNSDTFHIHGGRTITLQGITIVNQRNGGNRDGLELDAGASAVVTSCTFGPVKGRGIVTAGGSTITIARSVATDCDGGALILGGDFVVENTAVFGNNGAGASLSHDGVFRFDVVHDNGGGGVVCNGGANVDVQASIVADNSISGCNDAGDNIVDISAAAFDVDGIHVLGSSTAIDHAASSCPAIDFDGNARPINGVCDAGVDERQR